MIWPTDVRKQCEVFSRGSGVKVTSGAQRIILRILNAIVSDPHPSWGIHARETRQGLADSYVSRIPEILSFIAQRIDQQTITTFDILVHFKSVCDLFCFK